MSNVRSMLIEEFNKEFEELNDFFVQEIIHNLDYDIDFGYFDDYSVEKINSLFGRRKVIFKNQEELFNALKLVFEYGLDNVIVCAGEVFPFTIPKFTVPLCIFGTNSLI